jgi:hypothetical protein
MLRRMQQCGWRLRSATMDQSIPGLTPNRLRHKAQPSRFWKPTVYDVYFSTLRSSLPNERVFHCFCFGRPRRSRRGAQERSRQAADSIELSMKGMVSSSEWTSSVPTDSASIRRPSKPNTLAHAWPSTTARSTSRVRFWPLGWRLRPFNIDGKDHRRCIGWSDARPAGPENEVTATYREACQRATPGPPGDPLLP